MSGTKSRGGEGERALDGRAGGWADGAARLAAGARSATTHASMEKREPGAWVQPNGIKLAIAGALSHPATARPTPATRTCPAPKNRKVCCCSGGTPGTRSAPSSAASATAAVAWMSSLKVGTPAACSRCGGRRGTRAQAGEAGDTRGSVLQAQGHTSLRLCGLAPAAGSRAPTRLLPHTYRS